MEWGLYFGKVMMKEYNDIVLSVKDVSKCFEIYEKPVHRLYQTLCVGKRKFYKEFWALKDISFDVHRGECVGIIGRNGAGKSTLLQIITGTLSPTTGSVDVRGRIAALLELGSGFNPEFTGRENVYLNGAILGFGKAEIDARYDEIVSFADIGEFIDQPVKTYSSGMMVRLAFAVQVMVDPDILIVDEALAVGDALFQKKCFARINELVAKGVTFIFVTHDMETMRSMTQRALLLRRGRQILFDASSAVLLEYRRELHAAEEQYMNGMLKKLQQQEATRRAKVTLAQKDLSQVHDSMSSAKSETAGVICKNSRLASFGDKEAEIVKVTCYNAAGEESLNFYPGDCIRIRVEFVSHVKTDHLSVALRLRNKQGVKMYSWGTLNQDQTRASANASSALFWNREFQAGERAAVDFCCDCHLGADLYEVQAAVAYQGTLDYTAERILHWMDNALFFRVALDLKRYFFGGCVDMQMTAIEVA